MSLEWTRIEDAPEEWKDGRVVVLFDHNNLADKPPYSDYGKAFWYDVIDCTAENLDQAKEYYTHVAPITPPEPAR